MNVKIPKENPGICESLIIGYDSTNGKYSTVLVVGRKREGQAVDVINAFQGIEAEELYKKLITRKEKNND